MKNVLKYLLLALIAVSQLFACGGSDDEKTPADNFDVQFMQIPSHAHRVPVLP